MSVRARKDNTRSVERRDPDSRPASVPASPAGSDETPAPPQNGCEDAVERELTEISELVSNGRVPEARRRIRVLAEQRPEHAGARKVAEALGPPRAVPRWGATRSRLKEIAWLREHAREYPGEWLAVLDDQLLAHAGSLRGVRRVLETQPCGDEVRIHLQPVDDPVC